MGLRRGALLEGSERIERRPLEELRALTGLAPARARVTARGKVRGSAVDMVTLMTLTDLDGMRTVLHWEADVIIRGVIARVGGRLVQGAADTITQRLFACIKSKLEAPTSATAR